jgi:PTS system galactitol-specific IIC component
MLVLRLTRTVNIDLWNYWSFLLAGSIIFTITEMQWIGILISMVIASITLVLSDIYAHNIENYFGLNGVSSPQANVICWAPVSHLITTVLNKIPLVKKIHIFYEEIQYRLGIFSEPMIIGFILGFIIGIITKYKNFYLNIGPNFLYGLTSGLKLSIIMILLPRAINILFMGLAPTIDSIRSFIKHRITKRTIYIGLDSIIFVGHPSVIGLSIIVIPLSVYMATLLPGNTLLPNADLVMIPLILIWAIALSGGDIFRSFISAIIIIPIVLFVTADMGNLLTNLFLKYNMELTEGYSQISSIGGSSNLFFWMLLQIIKPILNLFL